MSKQKEFTLKGEIKFNAKEEKQAFIKLGKFFLNIANKPSQEFENIITDGKIILSDNTILMKINGLFIRKIKMNEQKMFHFKGDAKFTADNVDHALQNWVNTF